MMRRTLATLALAVSLSSCTLALNDIPDCRPVTVPEDSAFLRPDPTGPGQWWAENSDGPLVGYSAEEDSDSTTYPDARCVRPN